MKDRPFDQRVERCLHKYLSFATPLSTGWDSIRLERIPSISRTLPGRTRCSRMQSRKSLGANWNGDARRKRPVGLRGSMGSLRFLDSTMARKFFLTFLFPSRVYFSYFSSSLAFRSFAMYIYSLKCHEQRSVSYRCEKDDNARLYHRRIKMTGGKEGGIAKKRNSWTASVHWSFSILRSFKYIGRYLLAVNACFTNIKLILILILIY